MIRKLRNSETYTPRIALPVRKALVASGLGKCVNPHFASLISVIERLNGQQMPDKFQALIAKCEPARRRFMPRR